jgi:hypothetical protein
MVFCFSFTGVKMGLKSVSGKLALYEMGEGVDELREVQKSALIFHRREQE